MIGTVKYNDLPRKQKKAIKMSFMQGFDCNKIRIKLLRTVMYGEKPDYKNLVVLVYELK